MHRQDGEYKLKDICVWLNPYTFSNHPVLKLIRVYSCAFVVPTAFFRLNYSDETFQIFCSMRLDILKSG